MIVKDTDPVWLRVLGGVLPEARNFVALGYFGMVYKILNMIEHDPTLLHDTAFIGIATMLVGTGGLGVVGSFFFGGTKTGSEVMKSQSETLSGQPAPGTVTTTTTPPEKEKV